MDVKTSEVLSSLGIDPSSCPTGTVKLLDSSEYKHFNEEVFKWSLNIYNRQVLAYEIESEHKRGVGLILRNLFSEKSRASHRTVVSVEPPLWHNFTPALPLVWKLGVVVLVEGPKDARFLHQFGIPTVAYLGSAPSIKHIRSIHRYAKVILWIPDNEPLDESVKRRRNQVIETSLKLNITLRQIKLPCKDAGELKNHLDYIPKLKDLVEESSLLVGGGFSELGDEIST